MPSEEIEPLRVRTLEYEAALQTPLYHHQAKYQYDFTDGAYSNLSRLLERREEAYQMQTTSPRRHTFQPESGSFSGIYSQWNAQRQSDIGL